MKPHQQTIAALAPALADGSLTALALLEDCLAAVAARDGELHAMLALAPTARAQAEACDRERRSGRLRGPLHGVPLVVKDNIDVAGLPSTSGARGLAGNVARRDADGVAALRHAGAVIVGKTNLSELSFEIRTRSSLGGDTRNPFLPPVTAGGSSGGTGAAVAAGYAPAGLGTDTGGSIRVPAAYTGLVGLRPTHGCLSLAGVAPLAPSTDTVGAIARCVADAVLLFRLLAGEPPRPPVASAGLRVGVLRQAFGADPAIAAVCAEALAALTQAGVALIDPVRLPDDLLPIGGAHIVDAEFAPAFDIYLAGRSGAPSDLAALIAGGGFPADHAAVLRRRMAPDRPDPAAILARHAALRAGMERLLRAERLDALIHPTGVVLPASLDNPANGWAPELAARSGWPALTLCAGLSPGGLPVGVELLAPSYKEATLFALGAAIERGCGTRPLPPDHSPERGAAPA